MKKIFLAFLVYLICFLSFSKESITKNYANLAHAKYKDSLILAEIMLSKINFFLEAPSEKKFLDVKKSWLKARTVYQQTEVFRFGNAIVDEWKGKIVLNKKDEKTILLNLLELVRYPNDYEEPLIKLSNKQFIF